MASTTHPSLDIRQYPTIEAARLAGTLILDAHGHMLVTWRAKRGGPIPVVQSQTHPVANLDVLEALLCCEQTARDYLGEKF